GDGVAQPWPTVPSVVAIRPATTTADPRRIEDIENTRAHLVLSQRSRIGNRRRSDAAGIAGKYWSRTVWSALCAVKTPLCRSFDFVGIPLFRRTRTRETARR